MKSSSGSGSRFGRDKFQIVYVNSFGRHRSGAVIHYGRTGPLRRHEEEAGSDAHVRLPDRKTSGGPTQPSPSGGRRPSPMPGATLSTGAKGQSKGNRAKSLKRLEARKAATDSLSSTKDRVKKPYHSSNRQDIGSQKAT
ncbi:UNVERIFIED_CONTAM: hypothetical protein K2H54_022890 [Gekko kuhli]